MCTCPSDGDQTGVGRELPHRFSAALVCLLLAISKGAAWGWASGTTLGLFGAAAVLLLVWAAGSCAPGNR